MKPTPPFSGGFIHAPFSVASGRVFTFLPTDPTERANRALAIRAEMAELGVPLPVRPDTDAKAVQRVSGTTTALPTTRNGFTAEMFVPLRGLANAYASKKVNSKQYTRLQLAP